MDVLLGDMSSQESQIYAAWAMLCNTVNTSHHSSVNQLKQAYNYDCMEETLLHTLQKNPGETFWQLRSQGHNQIEQLGFVHTIFFGKILQTFKSYASGNALTHPDFSKLPSSEPALQFQGLTRNLPLVLPPRLLRCPRLTWFHQLCAQPVCITWMTKKGNV